jgi:vacuolar-type H+-ATPase subunit E/Vma4
MTIHFVQVAFIKQETLEKAREIKVKADEEFAIEKVSVPSISWD